MLVNMHAKICQFTRIAMNSVNESFFYYRILIGAVFYGKIWDLGFFYLLTNLNSQAIIYI